MLGYTVNFPQNSNCYQNAEFVSKANALTAVENHAERYLTTLFLQLGIPVNKQGYQFLREAVWMVIQDPSLQRKLMHGLYPKIAELHNTSVYCVEHSMRCAITAAWNRGRPELAEKVLGRGVLTSYDKPTNGEMIALIAEHLKLEIQEYQFRQASLQNT